MTVPRRACCIVGAKLGIVWPAFCPCTLYCITTQLPLLCPLQKRCKFNEAAIKAAGLSNVRVHWARAEEAGECGVGQRGFAASPHRYCLL